jgi:hypothetical protein
MMMKILIIFYAIISDGVRVLRDDDVNALSESGRVLSANGHVLHESDRVLHENDRVLSVNFHVLLRNEHAINVYELLLR